MNKIALSVIVFFLLSIHELKCQTWMRIYGGNINTECYRTFEHYDKGILLSGCRHLGSNYFGWVLKADINGNELWSKSFGINGKFNKFNSFCLSTDGSIACIGGSNKLNNNCLDPLIVKLNGCGEKEWCKIYNSNNCNSFGMDINAIQGGGYVALISQWLNNTQSDVWLFRLNDSGNVIWSQKYVSNTNIFWSPDPESLMRTSDSCFLITGNSYTPDSLTPGSLLLKLFLVKVDLDGSAHFEEPWGMNNGIISDGTQSIENNRHEFFTSGRRARNDPPYGDAPSLFKSNKFGNPISFFDLKSKSDAGIATTINWFADSSLALSSFWSAPNGIDTTGVIKVSTSGSILTVKPIFTNTPNMFLYGSNITKDNKLLVSGFIEMTGGWLNSFAVKLNSDLEYDSVYTHPYTYDSLCPHPIVSDTIPIDDCQVVVVGLDEPEKNPEKTKLHIYPNPATEQVTIEMPQYIVRQNHNSTITSTTTYFQWNLTRLDIFDLTGKLMSSQEIPKQQTIVHINTSKWHRGMYFARLVFMNEGVAEARFVK
ncbi:MAG: T9SS type A sorting domain-containing protein [Bacteroidales bacterium]|nr:T9SS type A sorting domain-containing protein [Bacteroidales bacterium]